MKLVTRTFPLGVLLIALCLGTLALAPVVYAKTEISAGEAGDPGDGDGITSTSGNSGSSSETLVNEAAPRAIGSPIFLVPIFCGSVIVFQIIVFTTEFSAGK